MYKKITRLPDCQNEQMLIRWIIGFQHSVPVAVRAGEAEGTPVLKKEPHLDLIVYSQVEHTNIVH